MEDRMKAPMKGIVDRFGKAPTRLPNRVRRITTGSTMLDLGLDGGLPVGWATLFWGAKSGGKTTTAIRAAAINQRLCRHCLRPAIEWEPQEPDDPNDRWPVKGFCDCVAKGIVPIESILPPRGVNPNGTDEAMTKWAARKEEAAKRYQENSFDEFIVVHCDPENAFDVEWAETLGARPESFVFLRPETGEDAVDQLDAICQSTFADLLIVDSLAHFTPSKEIEESAYDWQQGLAARIINKGIRKWVSGAVKTANAGKVEAHWGLTQIWINQTRMKIGVKKGDPSVKPGGMGQDFGARQEVRFRSSYIDKERDMVTVKYGSDKDTFDIPVRETINFTIDKGPFMKKSNGHYVQALRDGDPEKGETYKTGDVIEAPDLFKVINYWGMVEKVSKGYDFGGKTYKTQTELKDALVNDPVVHEAVRQIIFERVLKGRG